jgi:UDP-glucose 4-epimerase
MDVTVIGCNGYMGRHLCRSLMAAGHAVHGYDLQKAVAGHTTSYAPLDVRQRTQFEGVRCDVAVCFFLAGLTGTVAGFERYEDFIDTNEKGLLAFLELCRQKGQRPRIVLPSSRLVYRGTQGVALREDAPLAGRTIYAQTKLACENYLQMYAACFGMDFTVARICVPYGFMDASMLAYGTIGHFLKSILERGVVEVFGDGAQRRSLIHIDDLCAFLMALAFLPAASRRILNVGGGEHRSVREIAECLANRFGATVRLAPWTDLYAAVESGDTVFDSAAAESLVKRAYAHSFASWVNSLEPDALRAKA